MIMKTGSATPVIRVQKVTYTYPVTNSGDTTQNDAKVSEDKCATMKYGSGDADGDRNCRPVKPVCA